MATPDIFVFELCQVGWWALRSPSTREWLPRARSELRKTELRLLSGGL